MPVVKIPTRLFRQLHMQPNERDFLRMFGPRLIARGFRLENTEDGWIAWPALVYDRTSDTLTVNQEPDGRIASNNQQLQHLLGRIKFGEAEASGLLYGLLLAEGDDRAKALAAIESSVPEDVLFFADTGGGSSRAGAATEPDNPMVDGRKIAERDICRRILLLFGLSEEPF